MLKWKHIIVVGIVLVGLGSSNVYAKNSMPNGTKQTDKLPIYTGQITKGVNRIFVETNNDRIWLMTQINEKKTIEK